MLGSSRERKFVNTKPVFFLHHFSGKGKQPNSAAPRHSLEVMKEKRKTHFVFLHFFAFLNVAERRLTGHLRKDSKLGKETCKAWERSARCCGSGLAPTSTAASTVASKRRYETMSRNPDPHPHQRHHQTQKNEKPTTLKKRSSPWSLHFLPPSPTLRPAYRKNERKWERKSQPPRSPRTQERGKNALFARGRKRQRGGKTKRKVEIERR